MPELSSTDTFDELARHFDDTSTRSCSNEEQALYAAFTGGGRRLELYFRRFPHPKTLRVGNNIIIPLFKHSKGLSLTTCGVVYK